MSTALPWDRWQPEQPITEAEPVEETELPYNPPTEEYVPPPDKPVYDTPDKPIGDLIERVRPETDFGKILKDAFSDALVEAGEKLKAGAKGYAKESWEGIKKGETVDVLHPTVTAETAKGKELIVADAKSRSMRTFVQGLAVDVIFAIVATVAVLTDMDPFVKETWILFGALLLKSVLSAIVSYFMRLKIQPTIKTPGQRMNVMPLPTRIDEDLSA